MQKTILESLDDLGFKVSEIAKSFGVDRSAVYQSIKGEGSRQIRVFIAKRLETKPSELWTCNNEKSLKLDDALYLVMNDE